MIKQELVETVLNSVCGISKPDMRFQSSKDLIISKENELTLNKKYEELLAKYNNSFKFTDKTK